MSPRNPVEELLGQIWAEVLGLEKVGINDNFFALGGDSILSIQIISRANMAGLVLSPKQLFGNQTIAELAKVVNTRVVIKAEQGLVTGQLSLSPIQKWLLEQKLPDVHHYNQSFLLSVPGELSLGNLQRLWEEILRHHDVLRLGFRESEGLWTAWHVESHPQVTVEEIDLTTVPISAQGKTIENLSNELQGSLDLASGTLWKVVLFNLGVQQGKRLLITIHHLVVDGVSWRILLEDLQRLESSKKALPEKQPDQSKSRFPKTPSPNRISYCWFSAASIKYTLESWPTPISVSVRV
jgi:hypothetical protein